MADATIAKLRRVRSALFLPASNPRAIAKARDLGLTQSAFRNSTGWPDPAQRMSCRDIATLSRRIIVDFPEYYHYDAEKSFTYNNISQENRNPLVQKGIADGLKTGHTEEGGYGLVASAERAGRRVIVVVNGLTSMRQRAEESERLLEWSFREFENVTLFAAGQAVETAKVWLGAQPSVPLVGGQDLVITMPRAWRRSASVQVEYKTPVPAPVAPGDVLRVLLPPRDDLGAAGRATSSASPDGGAAGATADAGSGLPSRETAAASAVPSRR